MGILYLVRHGSYGRDALSEQGIAEVQKTADEILNDLDTMSLESLAIFHSPLTRAVQSASILAQTLARFTPSVQSREELNCGESSIGLVVPDIMDVGIIVSHQPDIEDYCNVSLSTGKYVKRTI